MLTERIRKQFDGKSSESLEKLLLSQYPLGELVVAADGRLVFDTGVPNPNQVEANILIQTGMKLRWETDCERVWRVDDVSHAS